MVKGMFSQKVGYGRDIAAMYTVNKSTQMLPMPHIDCFSQQARSPEADGQSHSLLGKLTPLLNVDANTHLEEVENSIIDSSDKIFSVVWQGLLTMHLLSLSRRRPRGRVPPRILTTPSSALMGAFLCGDPEEISNYIKYVYMYTHTHHT